MAYGKSMEADFAIIKLPVGRFVARFFALEEVIDGMHLRHGNKRNVTAFSPDFQPPALSYVCSSTKALSN